MILAVLLSLFNISECDFRFSVFCLILSIIFGDCYNLQIKQEVRFLGFLIEKDVLQFFKKSEIAISRQ